MWIVWLIALYLGCGALGWFAQPWYAAAGLMVALWAVLAVPMLLSKARSFAVPGAPDGVFQLAGHTVEHGIAIYVFGLILGDVVLDRPRSITMEAAFLLVLVFVAIYVARRRLR